MPHRLSYWTNVEHFNGTAPSSGLRLSVPLSGFEPEPQLPAAGRPPFKLLGFFIHVQRSCSKQYQPCRPRPSRNAPLHCVLFTSMWGQKWSELQSNQNFFGQSLHYSIYLYALTVAHNAPVLRGWWYSSMTNHPLYAYSELFNFLIWLLFNSNAITLLLYFTTFISLEY